MSKDKKPDRFDLFNDDSLWGNQETDALTHDEIMDPNWNVRKTEQQKQHMSMKSSNNFSDADFKKQWHEKNIARFNDPVWRKQRAQRIQQYYQDTEWANSRTQNYLQTLQDNPEIIQNAVEKRKNNTQWQENIAKARRKQAKDPKWQQVTQAGLHSYLKSEQGKTDRKEAGEKRKNDPVWKRKTLIGRGVLPFYTPWGYYYDANVAAEESKTKNTHYEMDTRSKNKKVCAPGKIRLLISDPTQTDFYFITWADYDAVMGITGLPNESK